MKVDFEGMVTLIHDYQIKGAIARVEQKEQELIDARTARQMLQQDDSEARKLAQDILDMAEKLKAT
ncbi:hypothetical protein ES705_25358 [subsurface metagenome]